MSLRVEVTAADIAEGDRRNERFCPVALAIRRAVVDHSGVEVNRRRIAVSGVGCPMPRAVAAFVEGFDEGRHVEPFTFELELAP